MTLTVTVTVTVMRLRLFVTVKEGVKKKELSIKCIKHQREKVVETA